MSRLEISTPDATRRGSLSALSFAYIVIDSGTQFYTSKTAALEFEGLPENEQVSLDMVRFASIQVGVDLPTTLERLKTLIESTDNTLDPPTKGLRTRGALMFKNRGIAVSLGDGKRIVESQGADNIVRWTTSRERSAGFWDMAGRIPGVTYP